MRIKKNRGIESAGKEMASILCDKRGGIHVDFLPRGATINSEYYCRVPSDEHTRLRKKKAWFDHKGRVLFLQDNARAEYTAHRSTCTLQQLGWEVLPHSPYSPDLAPGDFHLFGPLKEFLGGQHFSTEEVKQAALGWFSRTDNLSTPKLSRH